MTRKTHFAFGALATVSVLGFLYRPHEHLIAAAVGGLIGSVFPDVDSPYGRLHKVFEAGSEEFPFLFSHRGLFHTPFLYLVAMAFCWLASPGSFMRAFAPFFLLGVASHLVLDSLNPTGVPVFFPFTKRRFSLAHLHTRGLADRWIGRVCAVLAVIILFSA